jgi:uncharacterized Tic20 family protein
MQAATMNAFSQHERVVDASADSGERTYATFQHLIGLLSVVEGGLLGLIGSIIMWRIKASQSPYLDDHGREATNFQISMLMYAIIGSIVLAIFTFGLGVLPWLGLLWVFRLVVGIKAAVAANHGQFYRYPACIRFIASPAYA